MITLQALIDDGKLELLQEMYRGWPFFSVTLDMIEMVGRELLQGIWGLSAACSANLPGAYLRKGLRSGLKGICQPLAGVQPGQPSWVVQAWT